MTARVHVAAALPQFRVSVAALPFRAEAASDPRDAIAVVDGSGPWWDAAAEAAAGGARAVLVADPVRTPVEAIDALAARIDVPVLVHRSRFRHDLVAQAIEARDGAAPRVLVAECRAESAELPALVRDAVGWVRALAGGSLEVVATGGTALLRARAARTVGTLIAIPTTIGGPVLRVRALGETTTELEIDAPFGQCEVSTSTARGRTVSPPLHESGARAALRRAIAVVTEGESAVGLADLADLRHDAVAAEAVRSGWMPSSFS